MAKSVVSRSMMPMNGPQSGDTFVVPQSMTYFSQSKGLNFTQPSGTLDSTWLTDCLNFRYELGYFVARHGFMLKGDIVTASTSPIMRVVDFVYNDQQSALIRFLTTKVQFWDGSSWVDASGTYTLTGTTDDDFTYTSYNNLLLFSNGVDGMFSYDPTTNSVKKIVGAPACQHLTTFNGRVIASSVFNVSSMPYRVQWSVKNDYTDWVGIGSGFEDLLSTPGGEIDGVTGVYPQTDYTALMVRERSTWQMTETGDVDAPFRFERLYAGLGSTWRDSIVVVPGAIVGFFNDDIYMISDRDIQKIGTPIARALKYRNGTAKVYGTYVRLTREYVFVQYDPNSNFAPYIYHWSFLDSGWTRDDFPAPNPRSLSVTSGIKRSLTIATSTGTIADAGTATIISEVDTVDIDELNSIIVADENRIWYEDAGAFTDQAVDGTFYTYEKRLTSGLLMLASMLNKVHVNGVQLVYESDTDVDCDIIVTDGDGLNQDDTTVPMTLTGSKSTEDVQGYGMHVATSPLRAVGHNKKVKFSSMDNTNYLKIVALVLSLTEGAEAGFGSFQ